jgi:hypothetical protein
MAKVIMPLMSGDASGQLGHGMVFLKGGFVRQYVKPSNPQTVNQMVVRNTMGDLQRELGKLGSLLKPELKTWFGSKWNSLIIGELLKNDKMALLAYQAEYTAFQSGKKAEWVIADTANVIELDPGSALYCVASMTYDIGLRLGATLDLTLPAEANAATVGAEWIDTAP